MSTRDQGALDAPIAVRPDRRGLARGRYLLSPFLRDYLTRPRDYIVPQQINARVAIPYRAGGAIGKIWNGKAKPADRMPRNRMPHYRVGVMVRQETSSASPLSNSSPVRSGCRGFSLNQTRAP